MTSSRSYDYDLALLTDFRFPGGTSVSAAEEIAVQSAAGYRTALVPLWSPRLRADRSFHPAITACVQRGMADLVRPDEPLRVKALVIRHPAIFIQDPEPRPRIEADQVVMVVNQTPQEDSDPREALYYDVPLTEIETRLTELFGDDILWAPIGPAVRDALLQAALPLKLSSSDWHNVFDADAWRVDRSRYVSDRPVIGRHSRPNWKKWASSAEEILAAYPDDGAFEVKVLGGAEVAKRILGRIPENWTVYPFGSVPPARFLGQVDFGVHYYHPDFNEAFGRTIAESLASGCPTVVPPRMRPLFEDACVYAELPDVRDTVIRLYQQPELYRAHSERGVVFVRDNFGHDVHRRRVEALIGKPEAPRGPTLSRRRPPTILFFAANGVGMGHLTRALAIARRLPESVRPAFATLSEGMKVVREAGYLCEYIPQHRGERWQRLLETRLVEIIRRVEAQGVVFDGTYPWRGLVRAKEATEVPFIWSRRAMWQKGKGEINLDYGRALDFVIEPGEFAQPYDQGRTTSDRRAVRKVRPILLLDEADLLGREEARAALGLSTTGRAVLLQLGAGNFADIASPAAATASRLMELGDTQVVFASSPIAHEQPDAIEGVERISAYPLSRFLRAFDFAVSAAGYNSFHELIGFAVPTVFIPSDRPLDDQRGRARYAEAAGVGLNLEGFSVHGLERCLEMILDDGRRQQMAARCREHFPGNGAQEAAETVLELLMEPSTALSLR